jgi:cation transporter-like permease
LCCSATLDGCAVAAQLAFGALVVDDAMGLGVWGRVALGVALAAVLWAAVMAGLVAQVVVYFVCTSYRRRRESPDDTVAKSLTDLGRKGASSRNGKRR